MDLYLKRNPNANKDVSLLIKGMIAFFYSKSSIFDRASLNPKFYLFSSLVETVDFNQSMR